MFITFWTKQRGNTEKYDQNNENKSGITQAALAKECDVVRQMIHYIENNNYDPTLEFTFIIYKALNSLFDEVYTYG